MPAPLSCSTLSRMALRLCGSTPDGRFVQNQEARRVQEADADVEAPLHAARETDPCARPRDPPAR